MSHIRIVNGNFIFESDLFLSEAELQKRLNAFVIDLLSPTVKVESVSNSHEKYDPPHEDEPINFEYSVFYSSPFTDMKIPVIKELRAYFGIGLREGKDMSENEGQTIRKSHFADCKRLYDRLKDKAYVYVYDPQGNCIVP